MGKISKKNPAIRMNKSVLKYACNLGELNLIQVSSFCSYLPGSGSEVQFLAYTALNRVALSLPLWALQTIGLNTITHL